MIKKTIIVVVAMLSAVVLNANEGMSPQERQNRLDYLYRTAMDYYHQGKYSNAIYYWQAILNLDPTQAQPERLIRDAREKIKDRAEPVHEEVKKYYENGEYIRAQERILILLDIDSANQDYRKVYTRLQEVAEIFSSIDKKDKVSMLIKNGVTNYLNKPEDIRKAYNYSRYASELEPSNQKVRRFLKLLEENHRSITDKEKPIKGMNFVDQSLFLALNHIYAGRYDLAISAAEDVLMVEPENVLALKRMGSAYYALGNKIKAREIWERALAIDPKDAEIKKFLNNR